MTKIETLNNGLSYVACLSEKHVYASIFESYVGGYTLSINDFRLESDTTSSVSSDDLAWLIRKMNNVMKNLQEEES